VLVVLVVLMLLVLLMRCGVAAVVYVFRLHRASAALV